MINIILIALLNVICFSTGALVTLVVVNMNNRANPGENKPVYTLKKSKKNDKNEEDSIIDPVTAQILANIDKYDGTGLGQEEIGGDYK